MKRTEDDFPSGYNYSPTDLHDVQMRVFVEENEDGTSKKSFLYADCGAHEVFEFKDWLERLEELETDPFGFFSSWDIEYTQPLFGEGIFPKGKEIDSLDDWKEEARLHVCVWTDWQLNDDEQYSFHEIASTREEAEEFISSVSTGVDKYGDEIEWNCKLILVE